MKASIHWGRFVWDSEKENLNIKRHGIGFREAVQVFLDPRRLILKDEKHSLDEERWHCIGRCGYKIVTVRFTYRGSQIRIIGAGRWRKERKLYEEKKMGRR